MEKATLLQRLSTRMENAINVLDNELKGLRTGRASINLLDPVVVETHGSKMSLAQVATISTPNARTITVQVWNKGMVKDVERAIAECHLGLNPITDCQLIRIAIPPLNKERRKYLVKLAHKYGENTKITVRNVRRDGNEDLKKLGKDNIIAKDEHHNLSEEIQKLTDDFVAKITSHVRQKEQEILTI